MRLARSWFIVTAAATASAILALAPAGPVGKGADQHGGRWPSAASASVSPGGGSGSMCRWSCS